MKINTKKCVPIKGSSLTKEEAMIKPNKYILTLTNPSSSNNDNDREEEHDDDTNREEVGRQVKYLPTMVYTPVLTSTRKAKESRRLVSDDDIEELNRNLAAKLSIGDEKKNGSNSEAEDGTAASSGHDEKHREIVEEKPLVGRYITSLFSYKTCETSNVKRSARIFAKGGQQPKINPVVA